MLNLLELSKIVIKKIFLCQVTRPIIYFNYIYIVFIWRFWRLLIFNISLLYKFLRLEAKSSITCRCCHILGSRIFPIRLYVTNRVKFSWWNSIVIDLGLNLLVIKLKILNRWMPLIINLVLFDQSRQNVIFWGLQNAWLPTLLRGKWILERLKIPLADHIGILQLILLDFLLLLVSGVEFHVIWFQLGTVKLFFSVWWLGVFFVESTCGVSALSSGGFIEVRASPSFVLFNSLFLFCGVVAFRVIYMRWWPATIISHLFISI